MADNIVDGKRIRALDQALQATLSQRLAVDAMSYAETKYITIQQLLDLIGSTTIVEFEDFTTEKSILDYTYNDGVLSGDSYALKKLLDPTYAYLYKAGGYPSYTNPLMLDGKLWITELEINGGVDVTNLTNALLRIRGVDEELAYSVEVDAFTIAQICSNNDNSIIHKFETGYDEFSFIRASKTIDDETLYDVLKLYASEIYIPEGIANRYLYLDANKRITYVTATVGGAIQPMPDILDWNGDMYKAYGEKKLEDPSFAYFFDSEEIPTFTNPLKLDGVFHATGFNISGGTPSRYYGTDAYNNLVPMETPSASIGVEWQEFEFKDVIAGTAQTWTIDIKCSVPYTILGADLESDGTLNGVLVMIDNQTVTGLSGLTVSTSVSSNEATAANVVALTQRVTLQSTIAYSGSPTLIRGKIRFQR